MKVANFYFSPEIFVTYRFGFGAIILLAVFFISKLPAPPKKIWAMLIALLAATAWAVSNIIMKAKLSKVNPIILTTWQMAIGAILLAIYTFSVGEIEVRWTLTSVACLLYNAVIASSLAFFLWAYILEHMQASKASISVLGVPVVGVLGGVICLGEPLTISIVSGMIMVLVEIVLVQQS